MGQGALARALAGCVRVKKPCGARVCEIFRLSEACACVAPLLHAQAPSLPRVASWRRPQLDAHGARIQLQDDGGSAAPLSATRSFA